MIDADIVARQVVEPEKPAWNEIVDHFGTDILLENKQIHRKKLGTIIFSQPEERKILNQIVHPRVIEEIDAEEQQLHQHNNNTLVVVDVPLLIEASMHESYPHVILVYVEEATQRQRLMNRDKISEQEALKKIRSQMPLSEKLKYVTHVIKNDETFEQTRAQVVAVYRRLSS